MENISSGAELALLLNIPPWKILDEVALDNKIPRLDLITPHEILPVSARIHEKVYCLAKAIPEIKRQWKFANANLRMAMDSSSILGSAMSVHPKWYIYVAGEAQRRLIHECRYLWALKKVEQFLSAYRRSSAHVEATQNNDRPVVETQGQKRTELSWEDFSIFLISEHTCRIKTPDGEKRYNYAELGMADKRKVDKPDQLWKLMQILAATGGYINWKTMAAYSGGKDSEKLDIKTLTKRLNRHLKIHFGIKDSIFTGHYKTTRGWKTKIKFFDHQPPLK
ncbi:MAG: hypothetical protein ACLP3B_05240 [Syntrophobacteraceae bacterium]